MLYLTPAQYRAANFGLDVSDMIDAELVPFLRRASTDVNDHCNVPIGHSFLGGTVVGETHTWPIDPYEREPNRRVFPYHRPVIDVTSMRIYATKNQYLSFDAAELYYEKSEGWIEPASANLTSYGLFGAAVLPFIGLGQPHAQLDYTYGFLLPVTERFFYQGEGGTTWRGSVGFWTADAVTVKVNGVTVLSSTYVLDRVEGTVRFTSGIPTGTDSVEVTYVTNQQEPIAQATGLIATDRLSSRRFTVAGIPASVTSFKVAEVAVDRRLARGAAMVTPSIPEEAVELLAPFQYRAFGWT